MRYLSAVRPPHYLSRSGGYSISSLKQSQCSKPENPAEAVRRQSPPGGGRSEGIHQVLLMRQDLVDEADSLGAGAPRTMPFDPKPAAAKAGAATAAGAPTRSRLKPVSPRVTDGPGKPLRIWIKWRAAWGKLPITTSLLFCSPFKGAKAQT